MSKHEGFSSEAEKAIFKELDEELDALRNAEAEMAFMPTSRPAIPGVDFDIKQSPQERARSAGDTMIWDRPQHSERKAS